MIVEQLKVKIALVIIDATQELRKKEAGAAVTPLVPAWDVKLTPNVKLHLTNRGRRKKRFD